MISAGCLRGLPVLALFVLALACGDKRTFPTPDTIPGPTPDPVPLPGEHFATTPPPRMIGRIAYIAQEGTTIHPFITNPDGSNTRELLASDSIYDFSGPSWSPDATKLVFASNLDGNAVWNIYTMNVDGTGVTKVVDRPETRDFAPSWSPSGQKFTFQSVEDTDNGFDIFLYDSVIDTVLNLTNRPGNDELASWSPDGMKIVFQASRASGDGTDIWMMDPDGSNTVQLTDIANVQSSAPVFSPDGSAIAFESIMHAPITADDATGDFEIYVMKSDGTERRCAFPHVVARRASHRL